MPFPNLNTITPIQISPKYASEKVTLKIDFVYLLATGDSIATISSVTASVIVGNDPTPSDIISGNPVKSGTQVQQLIISGIPGTKYLVEAIITTTLGSTLAGQVAFWVVTG